MSKVGKASKDQTTTQKGKKETNVSRARVFYKPSTKIGKVDGLTKKKSASFGGVEKQSKASTGLAGKRAKLNFYQRQNTAVLSYYNVRECVKGHLEYALTKYPSTSCATTLTKINAASGASDGTLTASNKRGLLKDYTAPTIRSFQLSQCAVDKIRMYIGKQVDRWLKGALQNSTQRKVQTTTVLDFYKAYRDIEFPSL